MHSIMCTSSWTAELAIVSFAIGQILPGPVRFFPEPVRFFLEPVRFFPEPILFLKFIRRHFVFPSVSFVCYIRFRLSSTSGGAQVCSLLIGSHFHSDFSSVFLFSRCLFSPIKYRQKCQVGVDTYTHNYCSYTIHQDTVRVPDTASYIRG
jgi:hypothetical protein